MQTHRFTEGSPFVDGTFSDALRDMPADDFVPVWLLLPATPAPADGYPVVIFQHGIGRFKEDGFAIANSFATAGFATILMDLPYHGARASDLTMADGDDEMDCPTGMIDPTPVICDPISGMCTNGCDGIQDATGTGFLSLNTSAIRDNLRQATLDHLTLLYTIGEQSETAGAWSSLDPNRISYVGQSFGGIAGANLLAYIDDNELSSAVLNVTGGDWTRLLQESVLGIPFNEDLNAADVCMYNTPTVRSPAARSPKTM